MKPKEYIEKYNLSKGWQSSYQKDFLNDLTSELIAFCEYCKAENNLKGFDNAVRVIRRKWDAISNKIPRGLPDNLWGYFFATTIAKLREELCSKQMQQRREENQRKRDEYERIKRMREDERMMWDDMARQAFYERIALFSLFLQSIPTASFEFMKLSTDASEEEIKKRYRELSMKMHPDMGGGQEGFVLLTEHKNKCLKWATMKRNEN